MTKQGLADVGVVGLGVMGRNIALNFADHGYRVAAFDLNESSVRRLLDEDRAEASDRPQRLIHGCSTIAALLAGLKPPRVIIVLVPAGEPVDAVCTSLIDAGASAHDIVVDCGNSLFVDTIRREREYRGRIRFFGSGVSGGETGARFGPSLMPGGDRAAWSELRPLWEAIAAKVDPRTGKPVEGAAPGRPVAGGEPCAAYIGENGAGHYVKMVHNGIEYADMQLICEAYHLLRECMRLSPAEIGRIFTDWNKGDLDSYLIEITADILLQNDPATGHPMVDVILDAAGQKGTGKWTAINALDLGVPATTITEAVFARSLSALKEERVRAAELLRSARIPTHGDLPGGFVDAVRGALYCSKICAYAQGFQLLQSGAREYGWSLDLGTIARIWRGGCIIRARFLQKIADAYAREPDLASLALDQYFREKMAHHDASWRAVVQTALMTHVPAPAFASALIWFDGYRTATLPTNLLQAQRDYFGAHSYERVDQPRGKRFHLDWPSRDRLQTEV